MESNQIQEQLIVFTRYPEPGRAKTRLAKALGAHEAAAVQKKLTEHTMEEVGKLRHSHTVSIRVFYSGGTRKEIQDWLGPDYTYREQGEGDLGLRMFRAAAEAFMKNFTRVVVIGTDCPLIKVRHIKEAFAALRRHDLVLGPATDGGYYLIGLRRIEKALFENISWGTDAVLKSTLQVAAEKGLSVDLLEILSDVDRPEDLKHISNNSDFK